MIYDFIIIGGGVAGSATSYHLTEENKSVLLLEKDRVCLGGSYPAGAFLSPKVGLKSYYNSFINQALNFSLTFYQKNFPTHLTETSLLKLPKDEKDRDKLLSYEPFMPPFIKKSKNELTFLKEEAKKFGGYQFKNAGILEIEGVCKKLTKKADVIENYRVKEIKYSDEVFQVGEFRGKNIILATGADTPIVDYSYINIRKLCGYRFDVETSTKVDYNISKDVAISTSKNGIVKIGATYLRGENCLENLKVDDKLLKRALEMVNLKEAKILKLYKGIRSASIDFFPILGEIIDVKKSLEKYPYIIHGSKLPSNLLIRKKNLYIINGLGSRGFVLAPFISKLLVDFILKNEELPEKIENSRLFYKWARRVRAKS